MSASIGATTRSPGPWITSAQPTKSRFYELAGNPAVTNLHKADGIMFHTLSARYADPNGRYVLVAGVINLLDEEPPRLGWDPWSPSATTPFNYNIPIGAGYDYLGRRVFASVSYSFTGP